MNESILSSAHSLVLNESVYKTLASNKKRPLYLHEWLLYLDKQLPLVSKAEIKSKQVTILDQMIGLFGSFPGPPIRHLIAKNIATLYSLGDCLTLYQTIDHCNEMLKSREHETQLNQMAKLCALSVLGALYEKLGRMCGASYEETVQILIKYMKSADSLVRIEIVQTFEKILYGLGTAAAASTHKDIYKQLKALVQDRVLEVRYASVKCLCEMMKHSSFLYSSSQLTSLSASLGSGQATMSANSSASAITINSTVLTSAVCAELEASVQLGFKALDSSSNYDVRICVAAYLAQLDYYSINQLQKQQGQLHQQLQLANASAPAGRLYF
jgi:hypothetical protein